MRKRMLRTLRAQSYTGNLRQSPTPASRHLRVCDTLHTLSVSGVLLNLPTAQHIAIINVHYLRAHAGAGCTLL